MTENVFTSEVSQMVFGWPLELLLKSIYLFGCVREVSNVLGSFFFLSAETVSCYLDWSLERSRTSSGRTFIKPNQSSGRKQNVSIWVLKVKQ